MRGAATGIVYATRPGGTTLDHDRAGGNPFATAIIECAARHDLPLGALLPKIAALTLRLSRRHQAPCWALPDAARGWRLHAAPGTLHERRLALVLVVSDYSASVVPSLQGAAHDERRIAAMLAAQGFSVLQGVASGRAGIVAALHSFVLLSRTFDTALLYCTGHGVYLGDRTYLLPADFAPRGAVTATAIRRQGLGIDRIAASCRARGTNVAFFAGCRQWVGGRS